MKKVKSLSVVRLAVLLSPGVVEVGGVRGWGGGVFLCIHSPNSTI